MVEPDGKPKAAASLTADVVARGRSRTQAYGEAGLWRGAAPPPAAAEPPVRVVLPPVRESRSARRPAIEEPRQEELAERDGAVEAAEAEPAAAPEEAEARPKDMGDLSFYLFCAVLVSATLVLLGMLFY